ncbi:MAG: HAD hydrolase family protein [Bacteroidia bacterium]|nr:HAD hydrolase family protein [Bacteroidia bacterium]
MQYTIALRLPYQENITCWKVKECYIPAGQVQRGQLLIEFWASDKTIFSYYSPEDGFVQLSLSQSDKYYFSGEKIGEIRYDSIVSECLSSLLQPIRAFIFDIDGVLTTGEVFAFEQEAVRVMNIKDGFAIQLAIKLGFQVAIISGGTSSGVHKRLAGLGVEDIFMSCHNKLSVYESYISQKGLNDGDVLYVGDDMPDIEVLKRVGVSTCPADAAWDIQQIVRWLLRSKAGTGCAREVIEATLRIQNRWYGDQNCYW